VEVTERLFEGSGTLAMWTLMTSVEAFLETRSAKHVSAASDLGFLDLLEANRALKELQQWFYGYAHC
jgi:hypothetical protein